MPISQSALSQSTFFNLCISPSISSIFSRGFLMVDYEIFFLLIQSKFQGMPVISISQGTSKVTFQLFLSLPSATSKGCFKFLMMILYLSLQQSNNLVQELSKMILSNSVNQTSLIRQQFVFPQFDITIKPVKLLFTFILFYYLPNSLYCLQIESMNSRTVSFLTIFLAESTLKKKPFYKETKFDLKPLYIVRLSIFDLSFALKNLPDLPIYTKFNFLMMPRRVWFKKDSNN